MDIGGSCHTTISIVNRQSAIGNEHTAEVLHKIGASGNRSDDLLHRNGLHSAIRSRHHNMAEVRWARPPKLGKAGPENGNNRNVQGGGNVHRAAVVAEQEGEAPDQSTKLSHR
jgi:hypothetical protein